MPTLFNQLDRASCIADVVAIARDYLARWTPEEIACLPRAVRPGRVRDEVDILDLHARLVDEYRTTRLSGDELAALQRLTGFMVQAARRIGKLAGGTDASDAQPAGAPSKASVGGGR